VAHVRCQKQPEGQKKAKKRKLSKRSGKIVESGTSFQLPVKWPAWTVLENLAIAQPQFAPPDLLEGSSARRQNRDEELGDTCDNFPFLVAGESSANSFMDKTRRYGGEAKMGQWNQR
jgi:hypothetical protein